ncbi:MAG: FIST C-terminal domain-containing protein [Treponema sp.]|jgi:hypothetical protein|nr:FIST C-terminal domain-containing protein [Treponema sp.]
MIKTFVAFTEEIDDAEAAVSELLAQLDPEHNFLAHSLGIVHCFSDFADGGMIRVISEKFPFDVVGSTTLSLAAPGVISRMGLTLTVLTSDTVSFVTGVSAPVGDEADGPVTELCRRLIDPLPQKPALLLPFIPFMYNVGGDEFIEKIDALSGGIPAFGTLAISNEPDFSRSYTIRNGEYFPGALVLAALIGDVDPVFHSASVTENNILKQKAIVTGVERNVLKTVNNMPAVKYLESVGLARNGKVEGIESMPLIFYLEDGSRLIRACIGAAADGGGVILCGAVPVNASLALATMGLEDVVNSTGDKISEILPAARGRGMLMYSCAGRYWAQGVQLTAEQERVAGSIGDQVPYHFVYSGGEIFPEFFDNGRVVNHLQNDSLIICIL